MAGCGGGLDVPNLRFYQLASHLQLIASWHKCDLVSIWHDIETSQSKCPLLNLLLMKNLPLALPKPAMIFAMKP